MYVLRYGHFCIPRVGIDGDPSGSGRLGKQKSPADEELKVGIASDARVRQDRRRLRCAGRCRFCPRRGRARVARPERAGACGSPRAAAEARLHPLAAGAGAAMRSFVVAFLGTTLVAPAAFAQQPTTPAPPQATDPASPADDAPPPAPKDAWAAAIERGMTDEHLKSRVDADRSAGQSDRKIAREVGVDRKTAARYTAVAKGLFEQGHEVTDDEVHEVAQRVQARPLSPPSDEWNEVTRLRPRARLRRRSRHGGARRHVQLRPRRYEPRGGRRSRRARGCHTRSPP